MSDEPDLKKSLISAFEMLKAQFGTLTNVMCDVAALRTAVLENSPEMQARYTEVFAQTVETMTPEIVSATKLFDDLILLLKVDSRWLN